MSIVEAITKRGKSVDDFLMKMLRSGASDDLYEIIKHQIASGGKRVRPAMTILSCEAVGEDIEAAIPAAVGIELIHNYTLIFDDMIDRADLRRGYPTVRAVYGDVMALLAGMHYREAIFEAARRSARSRNMERLFSWAIRRIIEGERLDILFEQAGRDSPYISKMMFKHISEGNYRKMIGAKTAVLFEAACKAGSFVGGGKTVQTKALSSYGWNCGMAFQIQDDLLDIIGETKKIGKQAGKDIREHKLGNAVILYSLKELSAPRRGRLLQILRSRAVTDTDVEEAVKIVLSTNASEKASAKSKEFVERAIVSLDILPPSEAKDLLGSIADFIVQRDY